MKTLWILIIGILLLAGFDYTNCCTEASDGDSRIIYYDGLKVWERRFNDSYESAHLVKNHKSSDTLHLSYDKGYLWAATAGLSDRLIFRARVSKNSSPREYEIEDLRVYNNFSDNFPLGRIKGIVPLRDKILVGFASGVVQQCKIKATVDDGSKCETAISTGQYISSFDYSHCDSYLYVSLLSGSIRRCSLDYTDGCQHVYSFNDVGRIEPIRAAFGAIWIGVKKNQLWKCPSNGRYRSKLSCELFHQYEGRSDKIEFIVATKDYLYVNFGQLDQISRCDPLVPKSCEPGFPKKSSMTALTFVQELREVCYKEN